MVKEAGYRMSVIGGGSTLFLSLFHLTISFII